MENIINKTKNQKNHRRFVGLVTHYYPRIGVAAVRLISPVKIGDRLHFVGPVTDFEEYLLSMQLEHRDITEGQENEEVGIKISQLAQEEDEVYEELDKDKEEKGFRKSAEEPLVLELEEEVTETEGGEAEEEPAESDFQALKEEMAEEEKRSKENGQTVY